MTKIRCRECWYCTPGCNGRDWCRYNEAYQEADKQKTRCKHYESKEEVYKSLKN